MEKQENLKRQLRELHESLANLDDPDSEIQTLLATIIRDIETLESKSLDLAEGDTDDWEATLLAIENQYPHFAQAVRAIIDTLGRMGI